MGKVKTLNVRLNPEKIVDKEILDYFDKSLIPKTTLVKTALIHEIERLKAQGDPYVKDELRTCLDTLTFDLILVKLDQKQEFLIHEKLCTPL